MAGLRNVGQAETGGLSADGPDGAVVEPTDDATRKAINAATPTPAAVPPNTTAVRTVVSSGKPKTM